MKNIFTIGMFFLLTALIVSAGQGSDEFSAQGVYPEFLTRQNIQVRDIDISGEHTEMRLENGINAASGQIPFSGGYLAVTIRHREERWLVEISHKGQIKTLEAKGSSDEFPRELAQTFNSFRSSSPTISFE